MPNIFINLSKSLKKRATQQLLLLHIRSKPISTTTVPVPTHQQIAHLILDQKSASQALETFRWASRLRNFTHNLSTYRVLIHKLCSFRQFDIVKQLLDEMPSSIGLPPDEDIFVTIVRGLGRAKMIREVIGVLDLVSKFGKSPPSLKLFNSILDILVKEDIDVAREFYRAKMMRSGVQGDDYTYGILMKGLCLTNRIGDGFKLLQVMKTRGVKPNVVVYNTLINALCKNGKVGRARSLMSEMKEFNVVTFNTLISAYSNENNIVQALIMIEKCFSNGFVPDVVPLTKVIDILCNAGRVSEAVEILERMEDKGGTIDVVTYNTLIKGFVRIGKVRVGRRYLKEMEMKGCLPNIDTYNALISGFCDSGMLDSALDMFNEMKRVGLIWNFVTYDTLIYALCSDGRMQDGFKILELMGESGGGSICRLRPYNSIIYGLYKDNRLDEALDFLKDMRNLFPKAVDRSLRILGLCQDGSIGEAKKVFDKMNEEYSFPSALIYASLVQGFCQNGCMKEAVELVNEMMSVGYFPVASTFNALIGGFCRQGNIGSASKFMEDVMERGCLPDSESFSILLNALCSEGDTQKASMLLLQMVEKGILPDYHSWNAMTNLEPPPPRGLAQVNRTPGAQDKKQNEKDDFFVNLGLAVRTLREELPSIFAKDLNYDIYRHFGEVDIDGSLVASHSSSNEEIVMVNNGCLCCTVRGDLVKLLLVLVKKKRDKFDHIVIETTAISSLNWHCVDLSAILPES
ncbi:Pentatricopeptide repeat-containing protein [Abeliophyllum distichum]|uniref:Pentatricopeptide repeat-containing protein n=1 Tax=Abeliophyllum distichum TaxID=126358 RepID=A0ABD1Q6T9_9LAMI